MKLRDLARRSRRAAPGRAPGSTDFPLATKRLLLRGWREGDLAPYAELTADPEVMRFVGSPQTESQAASEIGRFEEHWRRHGFGLAAVEDRRSGELAGWIGVMWLYGDPKTREVEIGWRLGRRWWGRGLATEGAVAVRDWAFPALELTRLVARADPDNAASRRVMEKIGMRYDRETQRPYGPEVVYVLPREDWEPADPAAG